MADLDVVVRDVVAVLDDIGIPYYIGGSVASSAHGLGRMTNDADFVADIEHGHVERLVAALADRFYIDAEMIHDAIDRGASFNVIHLDLAYKVDFFVRGRTRWSDAQMQRRALGPISQEPDAPSAQLASAEDMIVQKLRWYKMGGGVSDRQWSDVQGMLKVQRTRLDYAYIRHWAAELGLTDLLRQAMEDAGTDAGEWPGVRA